MPSLLRTLTSWAARLDLADVPERVVELTGSQLLSQLAAIRAGLAHPLGGRLVRAYGPPLQADPRQAACVLAALGSWLNLDDTAYAGHLGNSTVAVPLAYARARELDGRRLLAAVIAANECAARITAAATLGPLRGQSALHTHLAGGVAGRLRCEDAPPQRWTDALSLAFSSPPWPVMHAFLGGDAKLFNAFTPVRTAMDSCDAAAVGLGGPDDVLEHPDGFLSRFATVPLPEVLTRGLGERWHTETLSFKVRPGGPGVDAAVDCAVRLHPELPGDWLERLDRIDVDASVYTVHVGERSGRYAEGPGAALSSLLLAVPYCVATALLTGDLTVADFQEPAVRDPRRWELAARVRLRHDARLTRALFDSTAPFGEALREAGPRAVEWLGQLGGARLAELLDPAGAPAVDFADAVKRTPAHVTVGLTDGAVHRAVQDIPVGGNGPDTRARHGELMRHKYLTHGGSPATADAWADLAKLSGPEVARLVAASLPRVPAPR
ncbi:MmgE/PrpD family protein [Micromonospora mirobrigensis]|uniref:2-methylcitrate dehydratase PrpD n=1 Tax=Micromonospora mirobrigensis TaxID=262898 RepID=A0A1C5A0K7_9ACTN|nr:MmgE/PrpD family protein [Micromonospora mirobrigensis]SCF38554.1 2-methylcitrate dehydratase PrpD [Micromonospora mirobrigensis]